MSEQTINDNIRKKLTESVSQLDKADRVLSHMVSDIAPGLHITKTIAFPNLTSEQIKKVIDGNEELATVRSELYFDDEQPFQTFDILTPFLSHGSRPRSRFEEHHA